MKERYKLTIEPITPVHIGTGVELTPLDYKVASKLGRSDFKKFMYFKFSSDKILKRLIESEDINRLSQFDKASVQGNMKELQSFFQENFTDIDDLEYPCEVTSGFLKKYNENQGKDPYDNASKVYQIYRPEGLKTPVIPGSSLKGSIRTAILNAILYNICDDEYNELKDEFNSIRNDRDKPKFESKLQKALLGSYSDAKNDPFRAIQIADCSFPAKNSQVVGELYNVSLNQNNERLEPLGIQILAEAIKGFLMGESEKAETTLLIDTDLLRTNQIKKKISAQEIAISCNEFFEQQFYCEFKKFYEAAFDDSCNLIDKLSDIIAEIKEKNDNSFVVRVGRWSQVEFVTFGTDFRRPKTPKGKNGKPKSWGGTRTLFDYNGQYLPMGWCKCTVEKLT